MDSFDQMALAMLVIVLLLGVVFAMVGLDNIKNCEDVGGESKELSCYKVVDGKYVQGKPVKLNGKLRFVQNG